jgi:hypothetical protein
MQRIRYISESLKAYKGGGTEAKQVLLRPMHMQYLLLFRTDQL